MSFGLPPSYFFSYKPKHDNYVKLLKEIREALRQLSWKIIYEQPGSIQVSTGISLRSYGENVTITILKDNSILIKSQCTVPIQAYDWGKNRDNVMRFLGVLAKDS